MNNRNRNKGSMVQVTLLSGATAMINMASLPQKDWKTHSGHAPVTKEEVHSLQSQKVEGTKNLLIKKPSGAKLCVTQGEAEIFAFDYLTSLGYTIQTPQV